MDPTEKLADYIRDNKVNLSQLSRDTGIPYMHLYNSLANKGRTREIRAREFFEICRCLKISPKYFSSEEVPDEGKQ